MKERQRRPGRGMPFRKSTGPAQSGGWKATLRAFLLLVAVVKFLVVAAATVLIGLQAVSACGEPLRFAAIDRAQRRLLVLALVAPPCSTWFWVSTR